MLVGVVTLCLVLLLAGVLAGQAAPVSEVGEGHELPALDEAGVRPGMAIEINRWWPNGPWCSANSLFEGKEGAFYLGSKAQLVPLLVVYSAFDDDSSS